MDTKITARYDAPDPRPSQPAAPARAVNPPQPISPASEPRLVIELDEASGSYVYKTVDWVTGAILQQLPRADVLRQRASSAYSEGAVIKTEA